MTKSKDVAFSVLRQRLKRKRTRMFNKNPYCPFCEVKMILPEEIGYITNPCTGRKNLKSNPSNLCTIEHLISRIHPEGLTDERHKYGKIIICCMKCNNDRNKEMEKSLPIEELHRRSQRHGNGERTVTRQRYLTYNKVKMKFNGYNFKKRSDLAFRGSRDGDQYVNSEQVDDHYLVFMRAKDCKAYQVIDDKRVYLSAIPESYDDLIDDTKPYHLDIKEEGLALLPITGHSRTNMAYGVFKKRKSTRGTWIFDMDKDKSVFVYEYYQCTLYLAYDAMVFTASLKRTTLNEYIDAKQQVV